MKILPVMVLGAVGCLLADGAALAADDDDPCVRAVRSLSTDGADYKPGVDVHGRAVAPADVQPTLRVDPPRVIEFPVSLDLAKRLGFNTQGAYEGKIEVARVRIEGGRVTVNGQEVAPDDSAALIAACRASRR